MNNKQLNEYIALLLDVSRGDRLISSGQWAINFNSAMAMWEDRYPGTRPPAFKKIGPPPSCFKGKLPPIYKGEL